MVLETSFPRVFTFGLLLGLTFPAFAQTDQERAEALFQEGYTLYQQFYRPVAITSLEKAAKLGHAEAAYWVGEILRIRYSYMTAEAEQFYRQAAEGGEVYAMLRLGQKGKMCGTLRDCDYDREAWLDRAKDLALPRAEAGDTEAMMVLSSAYAIGGDPDQDFDWVERAAENGHAFAQFWMAVMLDEQERGFYWTDKGRRQDILKWLRVSAEQGFPKAMRKLAVKLRQQGQYEEGRYWIEKMAETDYYDALVEAGGQIMMGPDVCTLTDQVVRLGIFQLGNAPLCSGRSHFLHFAVWFRNPFPRKQGTQGIPSHSPEPEKSRRLVLPALPGLQAHRVAHRKIVA